MSINLSIRWADNTADLKRNLADGLNQIEATRASVDKLARSLGGENVIRSAHNLAAAIQKIGGEAGVLAGVEKLTFAELERGNAVLDRAVQKYLALGQAIPAPIAGLHQLIKAEVDAGHAAEAAAKKTSFLGDTFKSVFAGFTAAALVNRAVGAITDLGREALNTASTLVDLSNKTGLSTETIQRMQFVAKQSGSDMSAFSDAAFKLGVNIEEGTSKARQGAERLGLSFTALRSASPDQQFNMVVQALERMTDPQERNAAAVELFGKQAKEILPAIVDGYTKVAEGATIAGDAQIKALDRTAEAWDRWKARTTSSLINAVGSVILLRDAVKALTDDERAYILQADKSIKTTDDYSAAIIRAAEAKRLFGNLALTPSGAKDIPLPTETKPAGLESYSEQLRKATAEVNGLTAAQRLEIIAGQKVGATALELSDRFNVSELAIRLFKNEVGQTITKVKALTPAFQGPIEQLKNWGRQLELIEGAASRWELKTLDMVQASKQLGIALPTPSVEALLSTNLDGVMELWAAKLRAVETGFADVGDEITKMGRQVKPTMNDIGQGLTKVKDNSQSLSSALSSLSDDFAQMAQIGGDSFSGIARSIGFAVKAAESLSKLSSLMTTVGSSGSGGGWSAANIAAFASIWVGVATAVYSLISAYEQMQDAEIAAERRSRWIATLATDFHSATGFSGQLNQSIADTAKRLQETNIGWFAASGQRARFAAESLNLVGIIGELGGVSRLTAEQLARVQQHAVSLFDVITVGGPIAAEAIETMDVVLADMGTTAAKNGGLVDKFFLDMAAKAKAAGVELQGVADFMQGQASIAESGLGAALKVTNDAYAKRKDLQKQIADLEATRGGQRAGSEDYAKTTQQLEKLNAELLTQNNIISATGLHSQQAADAVSGSLIGILNSQMAAGKSFLESIRAVAPSVDSLQAQMEAAGYSGGAAFDFLKAQVALVNDAVAGPALQAIEGYAQGLVGLNNSGLLNQDTFAGLSSQIGATRDALVAQGKDGGQVLSAMRGPLQTLWQLQDKFKFTTDESTQALIDEAKAQGLVGDKFKPIGEQMLDATNRIADAVEGLADLFGVLPKAAKDAATGISDELGRIRIPRLDMEVGYLPVPEGVTLPSGAQSYRVPSFASGSHGILDFGLGTLARLDGREAVVTEAEFQAMTRPATIRHDAGPMPMDLTRLVSAIEELAGRPVHVQIEGKTVVLAVADTVAKGHGRRELINGMGLA